MSGLDIAVSVLALLGAVITTTEILHDAYRQMEGLPGLCDRLKDRLEGIEDIVQIVKDEEELRSPKVITQLVKLHKRGTMIESTLQSIDPSGRGRMRRFFGELKKAIKGKDDKETIADIIGDIEGDKATLTIAIQVVGVGLTKRHDRIVVIADDARRIDAILRDKLGLTPGLRIMSIIEGRGPEPHAEITLTEEELHDLEAFMAPTARGRGLNAQGRQEYTERIIIDNVAEAKATQINGPIGDDIWKNINRLIVKNNRASAFSTQINYPIALDAFYSTALLQLVFFVFLAYVFSFPLSYFFQTN